MKGASARRIVRWHVHRLHELAEQPDGGRYVDFVLTPSSPDMPPGLVEAPPETWASFESDELEWWTLDEEAQVEGWTLERTFLEAVAGSYPEVPAGILEERQLEEDMVFLQVLEDEGAWLAAYDQVRSEAGLPVSPNGGAWLAGWVPLDALLRIEGAGWVDFTRQARRMTKRRYRKLLGEPEETAPEEEGGVYETER